MTVFNPSKGTVMLQYTVHLECPGLPAAHRIQAEVRYARALEKALGGPAGVVLACQAWTAAVEADAQDLRPQALAQAQRWQRAADQARQAGLQDVGEAESCYFDVRLVEREDEPQDELQAVAQSAEA